MTKTSFKQLLRTPWKTLLFFALMAACALLLVFGSVMLSETEQRIAAVEESFTTIGMVEQEPLLAQGEKVFTNNDCDGVWQAGSRDIYADKISVDVLDFEGAEFIHPPKSRPVYAAKIGQLTARHLSESSKGNYVQFTALDDMEKHGQPTPIRIDKILCSEPVPDYYSAFVGAFEDECGAAKSLKEGETYYFCECLTFYSGDPVKSLEKGKSYVANLAYYLCQNHTFMEMRLSQGPRLRQYRPDGTQIETPYSVLSRLDEVTDGYWDEGGRGQDWWNAISFEEERTHLFSVTPTDSLSLIPAFHCQQAFVEQGREITEEEFASGSPVCMAADTLVKTAGLQVGDKIPFSILYAMYNNDIITAQEDFYWFSNMDADGDLYQPFWEAEYEIVGTYSTVPGDATNDGHLPYQCFIVPANSIHGDDSGNIVEYGYATPWTCTFQIKNGTIAEFDASLRAHVPEMDSLTVTYNDNGYTDIMASLTSTRTTALLLFAVGAAADIAVVILLLYFFVVRQKKRTAIEQSLGMTRAQCRASILAGLLVLTLLACIIGGTLGGVLIGKTDLAAPGELTNIYSETEETAVEEIKTADVTLFNTKYSLWAGGEEDQDFTAEAAAPAWLFAAGPAVLWLLVLVLAAVLTNRNLKTDPILLLGGKEE